MEIRWYGQACFLIKADGEGKEEVRIVIDPPKEETGLKASFEEAEVLILSDGKKTKSMPKHRVLIDAQGEYEIKNIFFKGISINGGEVYVIESEEVKICHLGAFAAKELTPEQIEEIGEIDILTIPVGGGDVITGAEAVKIANQIEPKIIIPTCFNIPKLKIKQEDAKGFLKAFGQEATEEQPKLSITKEKLPEKTTVTILKPN